MRGARRVRARAGAVIPAGAALQAGELPWGRQRERTCQAEGTAHERLDRSASARRSEEARAGACSWFRNQLVEVAPGPVAGCGPGTSWWSGRYAMVSVWSPQGDPLKIRHISAALFLNRQTAKAFFFNREVAKLAKSRARRELPLPSRRLRQENRFLARTVARPRTGSLAQGRRESGRIPGAHPSSRPSRLRG